MITITVVDRATNQPTRVKIEGYNFIEQYAIDYTKLKQLFNYGKLILEKDIIYFNSNNYTYRRVLKNALIEWLKNEFKDTINSDWLEIIKEL